MCLPVRTHRWQREPDVPSVLPRPLADTAVAPGMLAIVGLGAMYLPTYWVAANGLWQSDDFSHAPIILAVVLWLFWKIRKEIQVTPDQPLHFLGWFLLILGVLLYLFGRTFTIASAEFLSQPFVVGALLLLLKGSAALRIAWFVVIYLLFMVPLPATLVDAVTGPLKHWISIIVVEVMYAAGYPITRAGVTIAIGQYQMLVADACSGLNSIVSLSALGTLFMYIAGRSGPWHNTIMLVAIIPIAFAANVVRVLTLILITYHFGDEAGQGFLHGTAGIVLMLVALGLFFVLDVALTFGFKYICRRRGFT